ncbi:hypothetical protein V8C35DRAFT_282256 [Trichoderma chlorosporum]
MANPTDQALFADLATFLARATLNQKQQLQTFLVSQPGYLTPVSLLPLDELTTRYEIIEQLRRQFPQLLNREGPFPFFSYIQISALLLVPMNVLQSLSEDPISLLSVLIPQQALRLSIDGRFSNEDGTKKRKSSLASADASNNSAGSSGKGNAKSLHRNANERDKCYDRDGQMCVLTKAALPDACHILPFAITSNIQSLTTYLQSSLITMLEGPEALLHQVIRRDLLDSLDKSWNMICLHPTLRRWWSKQLFGLKCLGLINNGASTQVQIQFYWMPRNGLKPYDLVQPPYDNAVTEMLQTVVTPNNHEIIADVQRDSFHQLETGHTFEIVVETEDAVKMKAAFDLQWAIVRLAAISGAAGVQELGDPSEIDEEDTDSVANTSERVTDWLEGTNLELP